MGILEEKLYWEKAKLAGLKWEMWAVPNSRGSSDRYKGDKFYPQ